jgi:hypothetical protein
MSGNFSEEYAICFQIGIIAFFFLMYIPNNRRFSRPIAAFGMGILTGLVFCLKQTYVDLSISIFLLIIIKSWVEKDKKIIQHLFWMVLGFTLVNLLFFLYFYFHEALNDYIVGAFLFNRFYAKPGLVEWMHAFLETFEFTSAYPFFFLMGCLWLGSVSFLLIKSWPAVNQFIHHLLGKLVTLSIGVVCLGLFTVAQSHGESPGIGLLEGLLLIAGIIFTGTAIILFVRKNTSIQGKSWKEEINLNLLNALDTKRPNAALFLILGLLDLPIVIFSISISGMNFPHYYISLFTPLFLFFSRLVCFYPGYRSRPDYKNLMFRTEV